MHTPQIPSRSKSRFGHDGVIRGMQGRWMSGKSERVVSGLVANLGHCIALPCLVHSETDSGVRRALPVCLSTDLTPVHTHTHAHTYHASPSREPDTLFTSLCSGACFTLTQNAHVYGMVVIDRGGGRRPDGDQLCPSHRSHRFNSHSSSHCRTVAPSHRLTAAACDALHAPTRSAKLAHVAWLLDRLHGSERDHAKQIWSRVTYACLFPAAPGPRFLTSGARRSSRPSLTARSAGALAAPRLSPRQHDDQALNAEIETGIASEDKIEACPGLYGG